MDLCYCSSCSHSRHGRGSIGCLLCNWSSGRCGCLSSRLAIGFRGRAITGDVTGLPAFVANLAGRVEWTAIWRGAVSRYVAQFPACIALHGLSLTVTSIVVGSTALVASRSAVVANEPTSEPTTITTSWSTSTAWRWCRVRGWAVAGQMADLSARITATSCGSTTETEGRAICLNVS